MQGMYQTPLYYAAYYGHFETVRLLLARGADKETKDEVRKVGRRNNGVVWRHSDV